VLAVPANKNKYSYQPLLDRVARQADALRDLAEGELVAHLHAPDAVDAGEMGGRGTCWPA